MIVLLVALPAFAAGPPPLPPSPNASTLPVEAPHAPSVGFGLDVVAEALRDTSLTEVYTSTALGGEARVLYPLPFYHLQAAASVGYHRMGGDEIDADGNPTSVPTWMWYAPVAATVGPHVELGHWDLGAAAGPAFVLWSEQAGDLTTRGYHGGKLGALVEGSARVGVGQTHAPLYDPTRAPVAFSIEGNVGWRWTWRPPGEPCGGAPCGLDFSALRLGLGVIAVF